MWRIDRDGLLATNVIEETNDAVFVINEYFRIRPVNYAIEKKIFGDTTAITRLAVFDTKKEAVEYLKKHVDELNAEEI